MFAAVFWAVLNIFCCLVAFVVEVKETLTPRRPKPKLKVSRLTPEEMASTVAVHFTPDPGFSREFWGALDENRHGGGSFGRSGDIGMD